MAVFVVTFFRWVNQLNVPLLRSTLSQSGDASLVGCYGGRVADLGFWRGLVVVGSDGGSSDGAVSHTSAVRGVGVWGSSLGGRVFVLHGWIWNQGTLPSSNEVCRRGMVPVICRTYSKSSPNVKSENPFPLPDSPIHQRSTTPVEICNRLDGEVVKDDG